MRFVVFFQAIQIPNKVATGGNSFSGVEREGSICGEKSIQLNIAPPTIAPVVKLIAGTECWCLNYLFCVGEGVMQGIR